MLPIRKGLRTFRNNTPIRALQSVSRHLIPNWRGFCSLLDKEYRTAREFGMPLSRRLWLWRRGFLSRSDEIFGLEQDTSDYISNYKYRTRLGEIGAPHKQVTDDKLVFNRFMEDFPEHAPPELAVITGGALYPLASGERQDSWAWISEALSQHGRLVLKPPDKFSGKGLLIVERSEDSFSVNGDPVDERDLRERVKGLEHYLISEYVEQAEYADKIFPDSANTIRLLTMLDPETGEAFSPAAFQRIGSDSSAPADNWSAGGYCAMVEQDTGELSAATTAPKDGELSWYDSHPDTGAQIEGVRVPRWGEVKSGVLEIAERLPYVPYIGWDIVITEDGFTALEANTAPDIELMQAHVPLKEDNQARRFYEYHLDQ